MNLKTKREILSLQNKGLGYKRIADILNIPVNTVKSFCYRNKPKEQNKMCKQCGLDIKQRPHRKKKQFCSDSCRLKWWNTHPEQIVHKTIIQNICSACGIKFDSYGKRTRKFCSRECYAKYRIKGEI